MIRNHLTYILAMAALAVTPIAVTAQGFPGGFGSQFSAPPTANPMSLLMRQEVQSEIHLDLRQRAALQELQGTAPQQIREQMQQNLQGLQNLTPEQRQAKMQELTATIRAQVQQFQGELTKKVEEILRPNQVTRLHELDLQFRGPLALADQRVADEVKISSEHRIAIVRINGDFQSKIQDFVQDFMADMRVRGFGPAATPGAAAGGQGFRRPNQTGPPDVEALFAPVQKKIEPIKKDAEEKAVAVLDEDEKKRWAAAQGEPFTFRKTTTTRPRGRG